jgi:peptide deformylase
MEGRKLVYYGNPILRQKCAPVEEIDDNVRNIIGDILRILKEHNGAGLCAPQVGEALRMFVVQVDSTDDDGVGFFTPPLICINPTVEVVGDESETTTEGCLSIPKVY